MNIEVELPITVYVDNVEAIWLSITTEQPVIEQNTLILEHLL